MLSAAWWYSLQAFSPPHYARCVLAAAVLNESRSCEVEGLCMDPIDRLDPMKTLKTLVMVSTLVYTCGDTRLGVRCARGRGSTGQRRSRPH